MGDLMARHEVIYFDTEFTCFSNPELLSLGAISTSGCEFYAEVVPIPFDACSDFVKAHVLPKFTGPQLSCEDLASRFLSWLGNFGKPVVLLSDSQYDRDLVNSLCGGYPLPIPGGHRCVWQPLPGIVTDNSHHALEDARGLLQAFGQQFLD